MKDLTTQTCVACEGGMEPLTPEEVESHMPQVKGWKFDKGALRKEYTFASFREAIAFVQKVADIAETEGHHPDICIWYKVVTLILTTHAIGGVSMNDFILAAKVDASL